MMYQKTVYFQTQEDLNRFNAVSNKAQWLHNKLEEDFVWQTSSEEQTTETTKVVASAPQKKDTVTTPNAPSANTEPMRFCKKHNAVIGFCRYGCTS
jgi:hypothetical protein